MAKSEIYRILFGAFFLLFLSFSFSAEGTVEPPSLYPLASSVERNSLPTSLAEQKSFTHQETVEEYEFSSSFAKEEIPFTLSEEEAEKFQKLSNHYQCDCLHQEGCKDCCVTCQQRPCCLDYEKYCYCCPEECDYGGGYGTGGTGVTGGTGGTGVGTTGGGTGGTTGTGDTDEGTGTTDTTDTGTTDETTTIIVDDVTGPATGILVGTGVDDIMIDTTGDFPDTTDGIIIPEPSTFIILGGAMGISAYLKRARKARNNKEPQP